MNCPRTSNQDRAKWRTECRKKLADHIRSRLDIAVLPGEVRLITRAEDPYRWNILTASTAALFKKQLSKHATGAYIDLCSGVGEHFEAVLAEGAVNYKQTRLPITICAKEPKRSIEIFRAGEWRERAEMESTKREALEVELEKAKAEITGLLHDNKALREAEAIQTHGLENRRLLLSKLSDMLRDRAHKSYEDSQQLTRFVGYLDVGSKPLLTD
ncbi:hypothetical protein V500_01501 [Pseudogymnoascus sp. VKM F-4518 (FW-2643)]|nr:hypothetical protein V500_01501 [Pseudogymnoascus sp. VKM F-4518 (FW-2643)]